MALYPGDWVPSLITPSRFRQQGAESGKDQVGLALTALQTPMIAASDGNAELVSPALENEGGAFRGPWVGRIG